MTSKTFAAAAATALALGLGAGTALAQSDAAITAGGDAMEVEIEDATLMVDAVTAPAEGFLVVHMMEDGSPGAVIGHAAVSAGENTDVEVTLEETPAPGDQLGLMLHDDTGVAGEYEFGMDGSSEDGPTMVDGQPVMVVVTVK